MKQNETTYSSGKLAVKLLYYIVLQAFVKRGKFRSRVKREIGQLDYSSLLLDWAYLVFFVPTRNYLKNREIIVFFIGLTISRLLGIYS